MHPIKTFHVRPALPGRLKALEELAYNLRWSWDHETINLFQRLDRPLWDASGHNPVLMLGSIAQEHLQELAQDDAFVAHLDLVAAGLRDYVASSSTWYQKEHSRLSSPLVGYFSLEFGLTESLPIYSGGLGILAGDHLKSASELGVPLVGVGLLYQKGYFRQYLTSDGWQQERRPSNDFSVMPLRPCYAADGAPVRVTVDLAGRTLALRPWHVQVGRVKLVLLDANIAENPPDLQDITGELYGGDSEMRIRQEIALGIGGVRALAALNLTPGVFHMNEGHCAFLGLERIRQLMCERQTSFYEALEIVAASGIFTTHTPVPAGIDVFSPDQVERYFAPFRERLGLGSEEFLDLGRVQQGRTEGAFNMAVLAIRTARVVNGVSRLHARISRTMWRELWPGVPVDEIPIAHVTNGVHPRSWISSEMAALYDSYLGPGWAEQSGDTRVWRRSEEIPSEELWRTHERGRERLVAFSRRRLTLQLRVPRAGGAEVAEAKQALDPKALTIGFARRFATYKRAMLILQDPVRLNTPIRPLEASGTSGMKAAFNGALNISILDGWWDEAYAPGVGWAIGQGEEYEDDEYRDRVETGALLDLLETEVVPLFYERGSDHVPHGWTNFMRTAIGTLCPVFNTNRMVSEYVKGYLGADERRIHLEEDASRRARELAHWKERVRRGWRDVQVARVEVTLRDQTSVGEEVDVRAWIRTGPLTAAEVAPQVYLGKLHGGREIGNPEIVPMSCQGEVGGDGILFRAVIPCRASGTHGLTVRVLPHHVDLGHPHETGLLVWASKDAVGEA